MGDDYFELAHLEHFWVRRRLDVLRRLAGHKISEGARIAEIGCGHGILQRQIEDTFGKPVTGIDLNGPALLQNISRNSPILCYNILQRDQDLKSAFDVVLMFDVLEHIDDEDRFLDATKFHLAPGGALIISVPALQMLFSAYDVSAGHVRRYSSRRLLNALTRNGFEIELWTYWGAPLVPLLGLRKAVLAVSAKSGSSAYKTGFDPGGKLQNQSLWWLSSCEVIPQKLIGASVMAVTRKAA